MSETAAAPTRDRNAAPTRDRNAEHDRMLRFLRGHGFLSHAQLVEVLGLEKVEIDHRHPDTGEIESKEVTDKETGQTRRVRLGGKDDKGSPITASVANDTIAARFYVQEHIEPGSTKPAKAKAA